MIKTKNMLDNLRFVFFTNETNLELINLTLKYFFRFTSEHNLKVSVISNKLNSLNLPYTNKVDYLEGNVEFQHNGGHFGKTLINTLPLIQEDYIFFFCDDYFLVDKLQVDKLANLLSFINKENIDYFGFDDIAGEEILSFKPYDSIDYPFTEFKFYYRDNNYRYLYSVQPTIWKKESLFQLAQLFPNISLHNLDETLPEIKSQNTFKCVCNSLNSHFSYTPLHSNYFILSYIEAIRHGVFHYPDNGFYLSPDYTSVKFIQNLIQEENLKNNKSFDKFFINEPG
jgi:hypothetical protein